MDKYIKDVYKALKCKKEERKRIINDLRTDIMIALENGETWQDIELRLGTAYDYAREFNENLGVVQKSYKKLVIGIIGGIVVAIVCIIGYQYLTKPSAIPLEQSTVFKEEQVKQTSQQIILYLNQRDYESIKLLSDDLLKNAIKADEMNKGFDQLGDLGKFINIKESEFVEYKDKNGKSAIGDIVVEYEKRTVIYRLSFNEDMKLNGVFMR